MIEDRVTRGFLASFEVFPPLLVQFQFNPDRLEDNKQVNFESQQGQAAAPTPRYVGGGERTIRFDFEVHGLEEGVDGLNPSGVDNGVAPVLATLRSFTHPRSEALLDMASTDAGKAVIAPPKCVFGFGDRLLECCVTQLTITETQFNKYLTPVRAEVSAMLTVIEEPGNPFNELERVRRNLLSGRQATLEFEAGVGQLRRGGGS